ncbi:MAG: replication initiator [Acidimicrobiales bacterium]
MEEIIVRAADAEAFDAWRQRAKSTGWCRNPIRLVGASERIDSLTGEIVSHFSSSGLPDRTLLKACGHRRATRCPACSATYQADAYQLVAAGLRGGKGIPESVSRHPAVFATLTAPSFGAVHAAFNGDQPNTGCRTGDGTCGHGRPKQCDIRHPTNDQIVGQPLCPECFDYIGAVLWNAHAGELWRRTTIAIHRAIANLSGTRRKELPRHVRLSFTKVVEYQRRGSVHVHAVIRLDHPDDVNRALDGQFDTRLLLTAIARAARRAIAPSPSTEGIAPPFRWGTQIDLRPIDQSGAPSKAVAGYLAKYATKSTDPAGVLDHRLKQNDLGHLEDRLSPHLARMVRTAWELGGRPELEHLRLRAWAHTLGFRGHWLTKSRRYSTTFAALRAARHDWQYKQHEDDPAPEETVTIGSWMFAGRGWSTDGDAWLAETAGAAAAESRRLAAEQRREERLASRAGNETERPDE